MKKALVFLLFVITFTLRAEAQFPYTLSVYYDTYTPLNSGATTVNSTVWFNSDTYTLPLGFDFKIDTISCVAPAIEGGSTFVTDTGKGIISGFYLTDANLIDRGFLDSISSTQSPIRYTVSGLTGQRIFKLEIANAAFFNEIIYSIKDDSINMQLWLYEGSNIVELHYGPSNVDHGYNYFPKEGHPTVGYVKDIDYDLNGTYYILSGNPNAPDIDSIVSTYGEYDHQPTGLTYFPPSGIVYRFTPTSLTITNQPALTRAINATRIYPISCHESINVDYQATADAGYKVISLNGTESSIAGKLQKGLNTIDISSLPPGMYMMQLQNDGGRKMQKFVKM